MIVTKNSLPGLIMFADFEKAYIISSNFECTKRVNFLAIMFICIKLFYNDICIYYKQW